MVISDAGENRFSKVIRIIECSGQRIECMVKDVGAKRQRIPPRGFVKGGELSEEECRVKIYFYYAKNLIFKC